MDEIIKNLNEFIEKMFDVIMLGSESLPLDESAAAYLTKVSALKTKLLSKMTDDIDFEWDKAYGEQFNRIITSSKIIINAINEILGVDDERN